MPGCPSAQEACDGGLTGPAHRGDTRNRGGKRLPSPEHSTARRTTPTSTRMGGPQPVRCCRRACGHHAPACRLPNTHAPRHPATQRARVRAHEGCPQRAQTQAQRHAMFGGYVPDGPRGPQISQRLHGDLYPVFPQQRYSRQPPKGDVHSTSISRGWTNRRSVCTYDGRLFSPKTRERKR